MILKDPSYRKRLEKPPSRPMLSILILKQNKTIFLVSSLQDAIDRTQQDD